MREAPEVSPVSEDVAPGTVNAALWVGWSYQILVMGILVLFHLPQQQAYIDSLANKPNQQWTQQDINMFLHPTASMIGTSTPFVLMFALSAWLLFKTGQGRVWARNVLIGLFGFRILVGIAVNQNAFTLIDVAAQAAVFVLLLMPASRAWFAAKNIAKSGGAADGFRVDG
jgi:hypothetical protein